MDNNIISLQDFKKAANEDAITQEEIREIDDLTKELIKEMRKDAAIQGMNGAEAFLWSTHDLPELHLIFSKMLERIEEVYTPEKKPIDK